MSQNKYKKPIIIIADPSLFLMAIIYIILNDGCCLIAIIWLIMRNRPEERGVIVIGFVLQIILTLILVLVGPQWFVRLIFLPTGIQMKPAWKKATERPYKYYAYVNRAWYRHGTPVGIGKTKEYIVFSHGRMNEEELHAINRVKSSENVIKIRYSQKTYQRLMDILPREMQYKLRVCGFEQRSLDQQS